MRVILTILFLISIQLNAQTQKNLKLIDFERNQYIRNTFNPSFYSKKKVPQTTQFIKSNITKEKYLFKVTPNLTYGISNSKESKLLAAIIQGIKHYSEFEFLADDYVQISTTKTYALKEFLRIKVHFISDTALFKKTATHQINNLEKLTQYETSELITLKEPIIVSYFSNTQETASGIVKQHKTLITHGNKVLYNSIKNNLTRTIIHSPKLNNITFKYKNGKMDLYLTGGLMDYTLSNLLTEINNQVHLEATGIKTIYDNHQNTSRNLKRLSYRGRVSLDKVIGNNLLQVNDI